MAVMFNCSVFNKLMNVSGGWLGDRKGIWPVKKMGVDLLVVTF